jgi:4-aminobutyrate aminotransferase-like enzyme
MPTRNHRDCRINVDYSTANCDSRTEVESPGRAPRKPCNSRGLSHGTPIYVAKAEDAWLEDVDGNRYLDFAGGIGCLNVGHRREPVVTAVKDQLDRFLHTCVQVTPYEATSGWPSG